MTPEFGPAFLDHVHQPRLIFILKSDHNASKITRTLIYTRRKYKASGSNVIIQVWVCTQIQITCSYQGSVHLWCELILLIFKG